MTPRLLRVAGWAYLAAAVLILGIIVAGAVWLR